jgi:hypothetical protein
MATTREEKLENALRVAVEHLMVAGLPKQNLAQFLSLVRNALACDEEEIRKCRERHDLVSRLKERLRTPAGGEGRLTVGELVEELKKHPPHRMATICFGGSEQHQPVSHVRHIWEEFVSIFYGEWD